MASPFKSPAVSRAAKSLISLATALSTSGSRMEDSWWESRLEEALDKALSSRSVKLVETALDALLEQRSPAYDALVEMAEARSESFSLTHAGEIWDALLVSAPFLAWTRYQMPDGVLSTEQSTQLAGLMRESVLVPQARLALVPQLVRFDCLPQSFRETRAWVQALARQAMGIRREGPELSTTQAPADLLADVYFLVGVVVVPAGEPIFQWQTSTPDKLPTRQSVAETWAQGCANILDAGFTGCQMEYLPPQSYYSSTRQADLKIRPLTLKAASTWLQMASRIRGSDLQAAIVACGDNGIEEYRVGFCTRNNEVIYGCVWPSLSREEFLADYIGGEASTTDTIAALLRETGIREIRRLPGTQPMDFCDDCGTPYFPDMLGDMQHPELPEEIDPEPVRFH